MNITTNRNFLQLGIDATKKAAMIAGIGVALVGTMAFANQFMYNAISKHEHSGIQSAVETVNDLSYGYTGHALTQSNETYREGLMERHMLDRIGGNVILGSTLNDEIKKVEKEIIHTNLSKAEKLGVFKDENKELFTNEMRLLDSAQIAEHSNDRTFSFDRDYSDPSDPNHFDVKNTTQLKNNVEKTLSQVRAKADSISNAPKHN